MERITVGQIIKAFGIRGEVKIKPITDNVERFQKLRTVFISGTTYKISACRIHEGFVYLKFIGVNDRNASELLVGNMLEIDRNDAVDLPEGRYFITDLIGCDLQLSSSAVVGKIIDVLQYGAADVIVVKTDKTICRFPFIKKLNADVDVNAKIMRVDEKTFFEVSVYED